MFNFFLVVVVVQRKTPPSLSSAKALKRFSRQHNQIKNGGMSVFGQLRPSCLQSCVCSGEVPLLDRFHRKEQCVHLCSSEHPHGIASLGRVFYGVNNAEAPSAEQVLKQRVGRLRLAGRAVDGGSVRFRPQFADNMRSMSSGLKVKFCDTNFISEVWSS